MKRDFLPMYNAGSCVYVRGGGFDCARWNWSADPVGMAKFIVTACNGHDNLLTLAHAYLGLISVDPLVGKAEIDRVRGILEKVSK